MGDYGSDVRGSELLEFIFDGAVRQLRSITITAKMREYDLLEFSGYNFADHGYGIIVTHMSMPAHDSLLYYPRANGVVLQLL